MSGMAVRSAGARVTRAPAGYPFAGVRVTR